MNVRKHSPRRWCYQPTSPRGEQLQPPEDLVSIWWWVGQWAGQVRPLVTPPSPQWMSPLAQTRLNPPPHTPAANLPGVQQQLATSIRRSWPPTCRGCTCWVLTLVCSTAPLRALSHTQALWLSLVQWAASHGAWPTPPSPVSPPRAALATVSERWWAFLALLDTRAWRLPPIKSLLASKHSS